jgi:hypothetical protein
MNENPWLAASDNMTRGDWTIVENAMFITAPQDISNHLHHMTDDDNSR